MLHGAREIGAVDPAMPRTMRRLALVQFATWLGLFCMWLYFAPAVAHNVFGAPDADSPLIPQGVEWARPVLRTVLGGVFLGRSCCRRWPALGRKARTACACCAARRG